MSESTTLDVVDPIAPATFNELELRSDRFRSGEPIILEDGSTYYFPRPNLVYRPSFKAGSIDSTVLETDLGETFNEAHRRLDDDDQTDEDGSPRDFISRMFGLAAAGLRFNYNLSDDDLGRLLAFRPGDEANQETWNAIVGTARGTYEKKQ